MLGSALLAALALAAPPALAAVREVPAGPIRDAWEAEDRCPDVCAREDAVWTGGWRAARLGGPARCECREGGR